MHTIDNKILVKIERIYAKVFEEKITHKQARNEVKAVLTELLLPIKIDHSIRSNANRKEMLSVINGKQSIVPGFHKTKNQTKNR